MQNADPNILLLLSQLASAPTHEPSQPVIRTEELLAALSSEAPYPYHASMHSTGPPAFPTPVTSQQQSLQVQLQLARLCSELAQLKTASSNSVQPSSQNQWAVQGPSQGAPQGLFGGPLQPQLTRSRPTTAPPANVPALRYPPIPPPARPTGPLKPILSTHSAPGDVAKGTAVFLGAAGSQNGGGTGVFIPAARPGAELSGPQSGPHTPRPPPPPRSTTSSQATQDGRYGVDSLLGQVLRANAAPTPIALPTVAPMASPFASVGYNTAPNATQPQVKASVNSAPQSPLPWVVHPSGRSARSSPALPNATYQPFGTQHPLLFEHNANAERASAAQGPTMAPTMQQQQQLQQQIAALTQQGVVDTKHLLVSKFGQDQRLLPENCFKGGPGALQTQMGQGALYVPGQGSLQGCPEGPSNSQQQQELLKALYRAACDGLALPMSHAASEGAMTDEWSGGLQSGYVTDGSSGLPSTPSNCGNGCWLPATWKYQTEARKRPARAPHGAPS